MNNSRLTCKASSLEIKSFFYRTTLLSEKIEDFTQGNEYNQQVLEKLREVLRCKKINWPLFGLSKEQFFEKVEEKVMLISLQYGIEFLIKEGNVMQFKPMIASKIDEKTLEKAVNEVVKEEKKRSQRNSHHAKQQS